MFKILLKTSNVESFQANLNIEIIKHKDGNYFFNGDAVKDCKYISLQSNGLICRKTSDYYFIENISSGRTIKLDASKNYSIGNVFSENGTFYTINSNFDEKVVEFRKDFFYHNFQSNEEKLLIRQGIGYFFINYNNCTKSIFRSYNKLSSLSLITGEYEWEVDLGEKLGIYDSIAKIVGVVDEVLWVISQRGILFGIEINRGELLYHLNYDNVESFKEIGNVSAKYFYSLFDEANKKLIGIYRNQCWEIDLTKPTTGLQVFDLEAINPTYFSHPDFYFRGSYWAAPEGVTFDNDYIYFRDIEVATVGIMHHQTKKIEWHTRLNDQEPMVRDVINDVQVSDNKLYVLDSGGTLHIFEKEEVA